VETWLDIALPLVARWEGCARRDKQTNLIHPYLDKLAKPNVWTRGYGRTFGITEDSPPISIGEAQAELGVGLNRYCHRVLESAPILSLYPPALAAVVSWTWNCGVGAFRRSRLCRAVNEWRWEDASRHILTPRTAGGVVYRGLARRRDAEAIVFRSAFYLE